MTALLIVLAVVYVLGVIVVALHGVLDWTVSREFQRDFPRRAQQYDLEARAAARRFVQSPLWPLLAIGALVRIYADSKETHEPTP
jgi:hypothetical protein